MLMNRQYFDCNCILGRVRCPSNGFYLTVDRLRETMETFGISEVLVRHATAVEWSPAEGNALLLDEIADHRDLIHPCWVVMPHHTGEMASPDDLVREMRDRDVRAAALYPGETHHKFSTEQFCCGDLFAALADSRVILFIDEAQTSWPDIDRVLGNHPELRLVVCNVSYRINRDLYPLLEKHRSLHIEISGYQTHRGIEDVVKRFGAERLLFGTRLPYFTPGVALAMVESAGIEENDREKIAGSNLRRLLADAFPG